MICLPHEKSFLKNVGLDAELTEMEIPEAQSEENVR